uniref:G_PROTEIN_RECEP_F1_2 domain-containing protein n=1 Tax=Angiostrongylus cantonensis TaxID=6313 RepID=A0A0K0CXF4_ANGCA
MKIIFFIFRSLTAYLRGPRIVADSVLPVKSVAMDGSMQEVSDSVEIHHEISDYLQMVFFLTFMLIGLPVNISTLIYMLGRYRRAKSFLLLLHINLNISDLLVLGTYVPGLVGWLITLEWRGGAVLCKVMRSNIMVCIALYRLYALRHPLWMSAVGHSCFRRMLLGSWLLATVSTSPQLFVWRQVDFGRIRQCVTIWTQKIVLKRNQNQMTELDFALMKLYGIQNAFITFYVPLMILVICYVLILKVMLSCFFPISYMFLIFKIIKEVY